jgi:hypothetical protein
MWILILILFICIICCVQGSSENLLLEKIMPHPDSETKINFKYPIYCYKTDPLFGIKLPDYDNTLLPYFSEALQAVSHQYRKNLLHSSYRAQAINLFRYGKKYKPARIICVCYHQEICDWFTRETKIPIVNFNPKYGGHMPQDLDFTKYRGCDLLAGNMYFLTRDFSFENIYASLRYNTDYLNYLYMNFQPQRALLCYRAFATNQEMEIVNGILQVAPYTHMNIVPEFMVECTGYVKFTKVNLAQIFSRCHIFNVCQRNLNYSNTSEYITYDEYLERKYVPKNVQKVIGPNIKITDKILTEPLMYFYEAMKPLSPFILDKRTTNGSIYIDFIENLNYNFPRYSLPPKISREGNIVRFGLGSIYEYCFNGLNCAFYTPEWNIHYMFLKYQGKIYTGYVPDARKKEYFDIHVVKTPPKNALQFPFLYEPALQKGADVFRKLLPNNPVCVWMETNTNTEFTAHLLHHIFPFALIKVLGDVEPQPWLINYEPIDNFEKHYVEPGDIIYEMIDSQI